MRNPSEIDKRINSQDILINPRGSKETNIELKSNVLKSLKAKIDHISSCYLTLRKEDKKANWPIKLKFYEDNDSKIEELENLKEVLDAEFQNINASYQNDINFIQLLKADEEISNVYLKYTETYSKFL
ncbi:unnamed protein product [Blepharisma stoltei]|uniref:Uncharacterized protein n=1 Tax=Blepharisma stoltei TaxID=1481888 RepID=A0AAU9IHN9_9CILI|nr:unnamed protein product [Blepharisma stoltei]